MPEIQSTHDNKKIVRGVFGGAAQTFISIVVSVVQIRLVMAFVPGEIAGTWFLFLSIGAYLAFFDLGVGPTLSREIGFAVGRDISAADKFREISDLIATCARLFRVISGVVITVACVAGLLFINNRDTSGSGDILLAWLIFASGAALNILGGTAFSALYGLGDVGAERLNRAIFQIVGLALSFLSLSLGFGIVGLASSWAVQNLLARISAWRLLYRYHPELKGLKGSPVAGIGTRIVAPSLKWAGMNLGALLILSSDNILIALLVGRPSIPPYEAVAKVISAIMLLSMLTISSSVPFLSKAHAAGDSSLFKTLFFRNLRFGVGIIVVFVSFFAVFGERVVNVWLGPGNFAGFPVLWLLAATLLLEVHHTIHATVTMSAGHIIFLRAALLAGGIKIAASVYLCRHFGIPGIAAGTLVAQLLTNNWYAPYMTLRIFSIPFRNYFSQIALPLLGLLAGTIGLNALLLRLTTGIPDVASLLVSLPLSLITGGAAFFFIILPSEDRSAFLRYLRGFYVAR